MQGLAARPGNAAALHHRLDHVGLVFLGDRREARDLPIFLRPDMADGVATLRPLGAVVSYSVIA